MSSGLETIAGASGGSLVRVVAGADFAFDRVLRETAAAYLLGVEPAESDRDGKPHRINVKVRVPNAEVRSRREVVMPKAGAPKPATLEEALAAAFRADRLETALPIRLATLSLAADVRAVTGSCQRRHRRGPTGPADIWTGLRHDRRLGPDAARSAGSSASVRARRVPPAPCRSRRGRRSRPAGTRSGSRRWMRPGAPEASTTPSRSASRRATACG